MKAAEVVVLVTVETQQLSPTLCLTSTSLANQGFYPYSIAFPIEGLFNWGRGVCGAEVAGREEIWVWREKERERL